MYSSSLLKAGADCVFSGEHREQWWVWEALPLTHCTPEKSHNNGSCNAPRSCWKDAIAFCVRNVSTFILCFLWGSSTSSAIWYDFWARAKGAVEGGRAKLFLLEREAEPFGRCCGVRLKSHVALSPTVCLLPAFPVPKSWHLCDC